MKRLAQIYPMTLSLFIPFIHISKLNEGPSLLYNLLRYRGFTSFLNELIPVTIEGLILAALFYAFVSKYAQKLSLFIWSLILTTIYYFFVPASSIYSQIPLFILASAMTFQTKDQSKHLFFALFFVTLLHTLSAFITCRNFYGYNLPLFVFMLSPILSLYLLSKKETYPSKSLLILLFPINIMPINALVHSPQALSPMFGLALTILIATQILLLVKRTEASLITMIIISLLSLLLIPSQLVIGFIFVPIALGIALMQLFWASKRPLSSHTPVLQHPMQPSSLSLRFYNEYMHY